MMRNKLLIVSAGLALAAIGFAQEAPVAATLLLKQGTSWDGTALQYPQGTPDVSSSVIEIAVGAQTGWHRHPVPAFAYLLEGELELELKDGSKQRVRAGESVIETVNTWHNGVNVGTTPVKLVAFFMGVKGRPLTEMEQAPE
jgi:quercetin dioxygenase-like cupin family protein